MKNLSSKAKALIAFFITLASVILLLVTDALFVLGSKLSVMSVLLMFSFFFDFYFCSEFLNSAFKIFSEEKSLKKLLTPNMLVCFLSSLPPFIVSTLNVLMVINVLNPHSLVGKPYAWIDYFTIVHPYMRLFYTARAIKLLTVFPSILKSDFLGKSLSAVNTAIGIILLSAFMLAFAILGKPVSEKFTGTYGSVLPLITFDISDRKDTLINNFYHMVEFEKKYSVRYIYYNGRPVYKSEKHINFDNTHFIFESRIVSFEGYDMIISGKKFNLPIHILILFSVLFTCITASVIDILLFVFFKKNVLSVFDSAFLGFDKDDYNLAFDAERVEIEEMRRLAVFYNDKWLPYKYRDAFLKDIAAWASFD